MSPLKARKFDVGRGRASRAGPHAARTDKGGRAAFVANQGLTLEQVFSMEARVYPQEFNRAAGQPPVSLGGE